RAALAKEGCWALGSGLLASNAAQRSRAQQPAWPVRYTAVSLRIVRRNSSNDQDRARAHRNGAGVERDVRHPLLSDVPRVRSLSADLVCTRPGALRDSRRDADAGADAWSRIRRAHECRRLLLGRAHDPDV